MLGNVDLSDEQTFRLHVAVIQPTPFCNIDCKYCYLPERAMFQKMSPHILERTFRFIFNAPKRLRKSIAVAWHAGEPLTLPISFYENALELEHRFAPPGVVVDNWFQTNGTLLSQDWCDFIKRMNIKIGLSLDGPQYLHDLNRIDRAGKGTFSRVIQAANLLRENEIPFDIFSVITEASLDYPEEIWRFCRELGATAIAFSLEEAKGNHFISSLQSDRTIPKVRSFMGTLLDLRDKEDPAVYIRELDCFIDGIPSWTTDFRMQENVPFCYVSILWNGNVSTFSPELSGIKDIRYGDFIFGNVDTDTLDSILENPKFRKVYAEITAGVQRCKSSCDYYCMCGGGAPSHKITEHGVFDVAETFACRQRVKTIGDVVLSTLENRVGISRASDRQVRERVSALAAVLNQRPQEGCNEKYKRSRALDEAESLVHPVR